MTGGAVDSQCASRSISEPLASLRLAADRLTDWKFHCWYWGDAIAIDGLLEADSLLAGAYRPHVMETLHRWFHRCPPNPDDALAPGAALIRLAISGDMPAAAADRVLDLLEGLPILRGVIPALEPHRHVFRFGFCIDAVYHLPALYALASIWKNDSRLATKAVRLALEGMEALRCKAGWAQWYDPTRRRNNDIAWSRGMGWAVLGLLDMAEVLEGRVTHEISDLSAAILCRLADTQQDDGNWSSVLDHPDADSETSTASFYVAACLHKSARGLVALPAQVLERATEACRRALQADGTYAGVTADVLPSWDVKTYEHCPTEPSPWAQGTAVRALAALARV